MKKIAFVLALCVLTNVFYAERTTAQNTELITGNLINGTLTGGMLGLATMGLKNDGSFAPFRIGVGTGILAGTAITIYDVATLPQGQQFFISGLFNDGSNSSIIILLDTMYGAAMGMAVGTAVIIIDNRSLVKGIQYGASVGAWIGFGVGLVDSFFIAERNRDFTSSRMKNQSLFTMNVDDNSSLDLLSPAMHSYVTADNGLLGIQTRPILNLITFRKSF